ncbi:MAG TPA: endonuclease/exonuclease/phosphatase family protein [Candidatus Binatia bacterium]|nr:endonuclease/exonuclease/phosphatase family protein [Candidatus Binatia bacterium]
MRPRAGLVAVLFLAAAVPAHAAAVRVVTFNVLHGGLGSELSGDGQQLERRLDLAAAGLGALGADVVALQEASVGAHRGDVAARLAARIGLPHVLLASPSGWLARLATLALRLAEGPALLTRLPVRRTESRAVARCDETLARALLCAELETTDGPLVACSTHLDGSACELASLATLLRARDADAPLLLMGDLNATEDAPGMAELRTALGLVDAFRDANPDLPGATVWQPVTVAPRVARRRVDYVLVAPGGGRTLAVRESRVVLDRPHRTPLGTLWASDHYGVLADLEVVPADGR